ncbi:MAG: hypothetical protein ACPGQS_11145 [Bradymonadia bacterium]
MQTKVTLATLCLMIVIGCSDVEPGKRILPESDGGPSGLDGEIESTMIDMMVGRPQEMGAPMPRPDLALDSALDAALEPDAMEVIDGDCDPRLMAAACEDGFFCRPSSEFEGVCVQGDGCDLVTNAGCDNPNAPECGLIGRATRCMPAGTGVSGDDCRGGPNGSRACADGLVCNGSICQALCEPDGMPCEDRARCADISEAVGQEVGLCVERNCDIFTGDGCNAGQTCRFAVATDGVTVGACGPAPAMPKLLGEPCTYGPNDDCARGFACVQASQGTVCRQLCDSGGYQVTCPEGRVCLETLVNEAGTIRGIGVCVTNQ